jgi:hypothetical protein
LRRAHGEHEVRIELPQRDDPARRIQSRVQVVEPVLGPEHLFGADPAVEDRSNERQGRARVLHRGERALELCQRLAHARSGDQRLQQKLAPRD